jgi:hypothetical protein
LQQHLQRYGRLPLFDLNFGWHTSRQETAVFP